MSRLSRWSVLAVGLAAASAAFAQDAAYPPELPPAAAARAAIDAAPETHAAAAGIDAGEAARRELVAGPYEWTARAGYARRRVTAPEPSANFREWDVGVERGLRLPAKAELDRRLGDQRVAEAGTALAAARTDAARRMLGLWYGWLRERSAAALLRRQADALAQEAAAVARRVELGDASRLEALQVEGAAAQAEAAARLAAGKEDAAATLLRGSFPELALPAAPSLPEPAAPGDELDGLVAAALARNPELRLALAAAERGRLEAGRARAERRPDPTVGIAYSRERGGDEGVLGVFVSIPLPGERRAAAADRGLAESAAAQARAEAVRRRLQAELGAGRAQVRAAHDNWLAARTSAERLRAAADKTALARSLGEADVATTLLARRQADQAELTAAIARIDALEAQRRLALDAQQLWEFADAAAPR